jgi:(1->4)-alpha-D-glucan 1-alpha-D-glucosylmutase
MTIEPRATYRIQLSPNFTLDDAAALLDYLAELGVSHLYCSPYLMATPGSDHGYDMVDPTQVNPELGGKSGHERLIAAHKQHAVNQLLDIVPNHMATASTNPWWWDVLENGQTSPYATYFDIAWERMEGSRENVILLPILGDHYGRVLEAGEIKLNLEEERFSLAVYDQRLPVDPRSTSIPLTAAAHSSGSETLAFLAGAFARLPKSSARDKESAHQRSRNARVLYKLLKRLRTESPEIESHIQRVIGDLNANPDALDRLLNLQNYRLAYWRMAESELGYRRFFDINSLIALQTQDEGVFRDVHTRILSWLGESWLDGVRVDHIDGLYDPRAYLDRLNAAHPEAWILVEKVLADNERLPDSWPVAGTTGYDFLNRVNGLFVDPAGQVALTDFYTDFTGIAESYPELERRQKVQAMEEILRGDVNRLEALFEEVCIRHRRFRDYTPAQRRRILMEVAASMRVYRTYVSPGGEGRGADVEVEDIVQVTHATREAAERSPTLDGEVFDFFRDLLLLRISGEVETELAMRFQQFTGPVMAKGVEDTAFYIYNRLVALNEVGGDPGRFGCSVTDFHHACEATQAHWPRTLLATSTHDTKRSEDVRTRLDVLSEVSERWIEAVKRWSAMNEELRIDCSPSRNDEYLLYQTMVGAWPIEEERLQEYMQKACREAMVHTSWNQPNEAYEDAVEDYVNGLYHNDTFIAEVEAFVADIQNEGRTRSLAQTLIKFTAPGVPDIYQGTELWELTLVDPDNRHPIDFDRRRKLLRELPSLSPEAILDRRDEGLPKLWVIRQALHLRRANPELFGALGSYDGLPVSGDRAVAFMRGGRAITVAPRLRRSDESAVVTLPPGRWRNVLTGDEVEGGKRRLDILLARFPVCLLLQDESQASINDGGVR